MTGIFRAKIIMETDLTYLVIAKNKEHAQERTKDADTSHFEEQSCTWNVTSIEEMSEEEIQMDNTHTIQMRPTQAQMYYQAVRKQGEVDQIFMEMTKGENAITKKELRAMICKRPSIWNRYAQFLDTDILKEK